MLNHDNAPAHKALIIQQFFVEKNVAVLGKPPYSPHLAPCDLFLFPMPQELIKKTNFSDFEAISKAVTTEPRKVPQESSQKCIHACQNIILKCV